MGTWRIGAYGSPDERARQVAAIKKGIELGINFIDTAEMYASGRSEEVVRDAVKDIRKEVFIATKTGKIDVVEFNDEEYGPYLVATIRDVFEVLRKSST